MRGPALRKAWIAYAAVLTAAIVIGELSNLRRGETFSWLTAANWVVTLALLTATWGYALRKPIATERYWRRVFWILLVASSLMLVRVALVSTAALVVVLLFMAVLFPAYFASYRYAFRCAHLWQPGP
jgi:hypothetical protein